MSSSWAKRKAAAADFAAEKELQTRKDEEIDVSVLTSDSAMGKGDDELFEKKLSKEEKKALAKKKREAKKAAKNKGKGGDDNDEDDTEELTAKMKALKNGGGDGEDGDDKNTKDDGIDHDASDKLAAEGTFVTYSANVRVLMQGQGILMLPMLQCSIWVPSIGRDGCCIESW